MKPENGHWYTPQGEPAHWQPRADGNGTTPTTIRHARKLGLFASVTTVLGVMDKPALRDWLIRQAVMAVVTAPDVPGEAIDAKITRILDTEQQQDQEAAMARDRGKEIHSALESAFNAKWGEVPDEMLPWIMPVFETLTKYGKVVATELILVGNGYAGRTDLILQDKDVPAVEIICDFKTTKKLPPKGSWTEHRWQLAAYARARALHRLPTLATATDLTPPPILTVNAYISTVDKGAYVIHKNPPWQKDFDKGFWPLFQVWCHLNQYYPADIK